jgi:hypothetical protein
VLRVLVSDALFLLLQQGAFQFQATSVETLSFTNHLNSYAIGTPLDSQASTLQTDDSLSLSPSSLDSVMVPEQSIKNENCGNSSSAVNSLSCMKSDQVNKFLHLIHLKDDSDTLMFVNQRIMVF